MKKYRVDFEKVYSVIITAKDEEEAMRIAEGMNEAEVSEAATYQSDVKIKHFSER